MTVGEVNIDEYHLPKTIRQFELIFFMTCPKYGDTLLRPCPADLSISTSTM